MLLFAAASWLCALPLPPVLAWLTLRQTRPRRVMTAVTRGLCLATVILCLAQPLLVIHSEDSTNVLALDLSRSADLDAAAKYLASNGGRYHAVVAFGEKATLVDHTLDVSDPAVLRGLRNGLNPSTDAETSLADGLRLAGMQVRSSGRIELFATGRNHRGDAEAEAWRLAQRGIAINTKAMAAVPNADVRVDRVDMPANARIGQTVSAKVTIESRVSGTATVRVMVGQTPAATLKRQVAPGMNRFSVDLPLAEPGLLAVRAGVTLDGNGEAMPVLATAVRVDVAARVLLVCDPADQTTAPAFATLLGDSVALRSVSPDELTEQALPDIQAIILSDVPADRLSGPSLKSIKQAVAGGCGLFVTGAARSFGPGGYADSELAGLLPVEMPQQMDSLDPSTTLALVIDTSGSMQGERIDLAKEVARLAIEKLRPHDKVGIVEFYGGRRWAAPLQSAGQQSVIQRALARLTAGGGTKLFPAVEEAAFALRNIHTRSKHVLIISDGFVENAPIGALVQQMTDDGIIVSTVQVTAGEGGSGNAMPDIARWGNGRFYIVPDEFSLPDISLKQPQVSLTSPLVQTPSRVTAGTDPLLAGAKDFGRIDGYARTRAKATADLLLRSESGDPLLVRWRYGVGFVAAMPTQIGSTMSAAVQNTPAFKRLMADLIRQLGAERRATLRIAPTIRPAGIEIDVTASQAEVAGSADTLTLQVIDEAGVVVRTLSGQQISAGRWNILVPELPAGAYSLTASVDGTPLSGVAAIAVTSPGPVVTGNEPLLERISAFADTAADRMATSPASQTEFFDLRPLLVVASISFLLANIAVRRWPSVKPAITF